MEEERDRLRRRAAALELLKSGWPQGGRPRYDGDHALVLCRLHDFRPGYLFLYERMRLYQGALACYMEEGDHRGLLQTATRLGHQGPQIWQDVLAYFGSCPTGDCSAEVREALAHVEEARILPPLVALQQLAKNPRLTLVRPTTPPRDCACAGAGDAAAGAAAGGSPW